MLFEDGGGTTSFRFSLLSEDAGNTKGEGPKKFFFSYFRFRAVERDNTVSWPKKLSPAMALYIIRYLFERELFFLNIYKTVVLKKPLIQENKQVPMIV